MKNILRLIVSRSLKLRRWVLRHLVPEIVWPSHIALEGGGTFPVRGMHYSFGVKRSLVRGEYETEERALVMHWIAPGMTVFEFGASAGFVTSCLAVKVGAEGHVVAVEADDGLAERLDAWIPGVYPQVTVHNGIALPVLQNQSFKVDRFSGGGPSLGGRATFEVMTAPAPDGPGSGAAPAPASDGSVDLGALMSMTGLAPDALVIDIEGSEEILLHQPPLLPDSVALIIIELHPGLYAGGAETERQIAETIKAQGFREVAHISDVYCFQRDANPQG